MASGVITITQNPTTLDFILDSNGNMICDSDGNLIYAN